MSKAKKIKQNKTHQRTVAPLIAYRRCQNKDCGHDKQKSESKKKKDI